MKSGKIFWIARCLLSYAMIKFHGWLHSFPLPKFMKNHSLLLLLLDCLALQKKLWSLLDASVYYRVVGFKVNVKRGHFPLRSRNGCPDGAAAITVPWGPRGTERNLGALGCLPEGPGDSQAPTRPSPLRHWAPFCSLRLLPVCNQSSNPPSPSLLLHIQQPQHPDRILKTTATGQYAFHRIWSLNSWVQSDPSH